ncbi:MAG: DUF1540 domain-containing protein [Oligoflexia bacterium]|nr:DUF1540 domain-containing protein [Oligoflexia bacterium]MBF0366972.1 DUF1540 domain-containing protein [Oligoflexia bacterium]
MKKTTLEMPTVNCKVNDCVYNSSEACHARAITVGDSNTPHCDTFLKSAIHVKNKSTHAGVGACKVSNCKFNEDFECITDGINVNAMDGSVLCKTYHDRK